MSTNHTTNYDLNQWEGTDKVLRTEFNADNAKIDAALKANADAASAAALAAVSKGNCQIVFGTYTGTGTAGSGNPNTLTFAKKPLIIFIAPATRIGSTNIQTMLLQGADWSYSEAYNQSHFTVSWSDNSVSWYHYSEDSFQLNKSGLTYLYIALLAAGE